MTSFFTDDVPLLPPANLGCATAFESPVSEPTVISPPKSVRFVICAVAPAVASVPPEAETLVVVDAAFTIDPSAGYENGPPKATASGGAVATCEPAPVSPGMITFTAHAVAV